MNNNNKDLEILPRTCITGMFNRIGDTYFINSPAVYTKNKTLTIGQVYEILEFRNEEDFWLKRIKLLYIYLRGYTFHLCGINIDTGELLKFSKRLSDMEVPSPWVIVELLFFENLPDKQAIKSYCEKDSDIFNTKNNTVGLEGIFHSTEDGYFLNSSCLLSEYQIIKRNEIYLFISANAETKEDISIVQLQDVFYEGGYVNLCVKNIISQTTSIISHCIAAPYQEHEWQIIELSFFIELLKNGFSFKF